MPPQQYTIQSFADSIRKSSPNGIDSSGVPYSQIKDDELAKRVIAKYPVYASQVQGYTPPVSVTPPDPHAEYQKQVNTAVGGAAKGAFDATQSGVEGMAKTLQDNTTVQNSNASPLNKLGKKISTVASLAGQGTGLLFNAAGGAVSGSGALDHLPEWLKAAPAAAVAAVQSNPEAMSALHSINSLAEQHPQIAQLLGGIVQIASNVGGAGGGAAAGEKAVGLVDNAVTTGTTAIKDAGRAATDAVGTKVADIGASRAAAKDASMLQDHIEQTMPLADKDARTQAIFNAGYADGGAERTGALGTTGIASTPEDITRGTLASPYMKGTKDFLKQSSNIGKGIIDRSKTLDTFLDKNSTPANFADMRKYIEANNRPSPYLQDDPGAFKAYNRANENGLATIYKEMKDTAKSTGDFGAITPGSDLRRARIAVDNQIEKQLGEKTLSEDQFRGVKVAEKNLRNVMNRMTEDTVRYPGQLEQLNKYNDWMSQLTKGNSEIPVDPAHAEALKAQFGLKSTPTTEAAAQSVADQHAEMEHLFDAKQNIADRNQAKIGKSNKVTDMLDRNPTLKAAVKVGKAALPYAGVTAVGETALGLTH